MDKIDYQSKVEGNYQSKPEEDECNVDEAASEYNVELKNNNEFYSMSHFDEASKAGFALNYEGEKLSHKKITPQQRRSNVNVKVIENQQIPTENGDFEKFNFEGDVNMLTDEKENINKRKTVEIINEEDNNLENSEENEEPVNLDEMSVHNREENTNEIVNHEADEELVHDVSDPKFYNKNLSEDEYIQEEENANNMNNNHKINDYNKNNNYSYKNPVNNNNNNKIKPNISNRNIEKKTKNLNSNKLSNNEFFLKDEELVKKFNEIKQTNTFRKYLMKQENGPQYFNMLDKTDIKKIAEFKKGKDLKKNFNEQNRSPIKNYANEEEINNNNKKRNNSDLLKIKSLEDENMRLKNRIKVVEQSKSLNFKNELEEENKELKELLDKKDNEIDQLQMKYDKKNRENIENKSKCDALQFDNELFQNKLNEMKSKNDSGDKESIATLKIDIKKKEEINQKLTEENNSLKSQIETIRNESISSKTELNKKLEKINEQQQKIFQLEQENFEFKSRSNGESQTMKEYKQNYENIKSNFLDLKNQNELLNMKYQSIADENFSLKRDLIFLEKEIKNKSEIIDRLRNELLETNKKSLSNDYYTSKYNNEVYFNLIKSSNSIGRDKTDYSSNYDNYSSNYNKNNKINESYNKSNEKNINSNNDNKKGSKNLNITNANSNTNINTSNKNVGKRGYYNDSVTNSMNILPSQMNNMKNENKLLDIENKLLKVQKERDFIQIEIEKLPEFPKTKVQILKKKNLEANIGEFNKEISKLKLDLKEIQTTYKD